MTDVNAMVERAARAIHASDQAFVDGDVPFDELTEAWKEERRRQGGAALLAALDPEDEALVAALTDAPTFGKLDVIDAQIIIGLIKKHAQGGSAGT